MTRIWGFFYAQKKKVRRNVSAKSSETNTFARALKFISRCAMFALCVVLSQGCAEREPIAEKAAREGRLIVGNGTDPATLDPSFATGTTEVKILNGLFEGLTRADSSTLKIQPAVAQTWEISKDGLTYTFKIDPLAMWSDGQRVSAKDFEFAWKRTLAPTLGAEYASMLFPIKNARAYNSGTLKDASKIGVKAVDDNTLQVQLEKPTPYFLSLLYHTSYFPLPERVLKKFNAHTTRNADWTKPKNIVTNGAFTLKKWSINDRVVIKKNPKFRDAKNIFLNEIVFLPISNINTEDRAFRAGQLHVTESVAPQRLESIKRDSPTTLRKDDWIGVYYYLINSTRPPLDNPKVRKALAMSIDRRAIIDAFLKAEQPSALSFIPNCAQDYALSNSAKIRENVVEAKRLLAEAGYPNGKNFPNIRITYNTSEQHKPIAEAIQEMWKKHLGINAELYNLSWPAYLSARKNRDFEIARASWIGDYAAPESFLEIFTSDSGLNHSGYANKYFDETLENARNATSNQKRFEYIAKAETQLLEDLPIIPIYFYSKVFRISPLVEGWHANILDYRNYVGVKLKNSENKK